MDVTIDEQWVVGKMAFWNLVVTCEQWVVGKMAFRNLVVLCELHYDFSYKIMGSKFQPPRLQVCNLSPMC
jgi:hypothetical protein